MEYKSYESAFEKFLNEDDKLTDTDSEIEIDESENDNEGDADGEEEGLQTEEQEQIEEQEQKQENEVDDNKEPEEKSTGSKIKVKINGLDVELEPDEAKQLLQDSIQYKNLVEANKSKIDLITNNDIDDKLLHALIDAESGDETAKKFLVQKFGLNDIDLYDEDEEVNYEPQLEYSVEKEIENIMSNIVSSDSELAGKVVNVFDNLPDKAKVEIYEPNKFKAFVDDVQNGVFEQVAPNAYKYMNTLGLNFIEAYTKSYTELAQQKQKESKKEPINTKDNSKTSKPSKSYKDLFAKFIKS